MAIIELVFPKVKNDPESIKGAQGTIPLAFKALKDGGVLRGAAGAIISENGKDTTGEFREFIALEWPEVSYFYKFVESPGYAEYKAAAQPFSSGPPDLNVFETNPGAHLFDGRPLLDILLISPKNASDDEAQAILKKVQSTLEKISDTEGVYGSSLNLPQKKIAIVRAIADKAELDAAKNASARQEILKEIGGLAEVTQLVADVKVMPF
ncbi:hypothetical protein F4815DRAFT_476698 [Daldinia loculata]|uniref:uncharacterized protein n=1 Tax=Daldinia loculata TaxID=103429 RepID=UPI0020C3BD65|nr:uncharacterized protein F4817DRAFT_320361 [Daldinia loculata]KAI1642889.1 hypothetical protein F4817DRAFT_320361 [Daldinia loculata]KAI2778584.1 hypothetical protein F4815DRAFT_476698 [Daldinia loculata]